MVKRKRSSGSSRTVRRRFHRRRRTRRPQQKLKAYSGEYGKTYSTGFKTKKTKGTKYRRHLWDSTLYKAHFRSIAGLSAIVSTPNDTIQATLERRRALFNGIDNFWTAAGGSTTIDAGVAVPTFGRTIVIRGGILRLTITNNSTDDTLKVKVWLVWANPTTESPIATPATVPFEWDPSCSADFTQFGKVMAQRETTLLPLSRPMEVVWRLQPQKIDRDTFGGNAGRQFFWWYSIGQLNNTEIVPAAESATVINTFNISFVGDEDNT